MEAKELMIGDWCAYGVNCKGRVTALTEHLITLSVDGNEVNGLYMLMPDMAHPIPLTEEILVKNGFVCTQDKEWPEVLYWEEEILVKNGFVCTQDKEWPEVLYWELETVEEYFAINENRLTDCVFYDYAGIYINYVHQLQHLLRLSGIEKEISI